NNSNKKNKCKLVSNKSSSSSSSNNNYCSDSSNDSEMNDYPTYTEAKDIQNKLLTLLFFIMGSQRREVIASLQIDVSGDTPLNNHN
ncbi:hypothetical protein, partial [Mycobacterium tuberculosis]|uniref:hypothetical protein n=1 Tax=Mycobacterium tuberculosis TaxID=1773 RepID=UPI00254DC6D4